MQEPFLSANWHRVAGIKARLHAHADITRHRTRGRSWYSVRNAANGEVFRFSPAVYQFLGLLDGRRTVEQAWSLVAEQLDAEAPTQDEVIRLLSQLHNADLLQTDEHPDFVELTGRHRKRFWSKLWQHIGNPMALRIPLLDPDRFLSRNLGWIAPLPGRLALVLWVLVVTPALVLAGVHWPELTTNLSDRMLSTEGLLAITLVFPVVKGLHEMGHAVAVKGGGGAVHEMGVMFLVLLPMPYVDASAASGFRSRWRRIAVGAAGILVETFVASLALFAWLLLEPGPARAACYATMVVAGISTVLFNANPLLRYDGYYMLSDLLGIPNLGSRATRMWGWLARRTLFGVQAPRPATAPGELPWLLAYAPASFAARLTVMTAMVMLVANRFFAIGVVLAVWTASVTLLWPIVSALLEVFTGPSLAARRGRAVGVTLSALAAFGLFAVLVPLPLHSVAEGVVWLPEESLVRAGADGFVRRLAVPSGSWVNPGTLIAVSDDPDQEAQIAVARAKLRALDAQYAGQQFDDRVEGGLTRREMELQQAILDDTIRRAGDLRSVARASGRFVVPRPEDLPGRFHKRGEVIGYVMPEQISVVRVLVDQEDVDLVRTRLHAVSVLPAADLEHSYPARMLREVPAASDELPSKALSTEGGGAQAIDPRDRQTPRTLQRLFQFDIEIPPEAAKHAAGGHVWVRFDHGSEPLADQLWRRVRQMFLSRFDA